MKQKADFSYVMVEHAEIHRRLENWAQWCRPKLKINVSPMFRLLRPDNFDREYGKTDRLVDMADALIIQRAFIRIPERNRLAIGWCYCDRRHPKQAMRKLGVADWQLMELIHDGRSMIRNISLDNKSQLMIIAATSSEYA